METKAKLTKAEEEKRKKTCYDIVRTIIEFGVSQKQMLTIISLLSREIEDREAMTDVINTSQHHINRLFNESDDKIVEKLVTKLR